MIISTSVKNGTLDLSPEEKEEMAQYIASLEGKSVWLLISDRKIPRTLLQNAYYWGVVVKMIADEIGDDTMSVHNILKDKFLPEFWVKEEGREVKMPKSTTRCSTKEFGEYIDQCIVHASSFHNIVIPEPNQSYSISQ